MAITLYSNNLQTGVIQGKNTPCQEVRLKVSFSQNLTSLGVLTNLTKVVLKSASHPDLSLLRNLTELKMVNCIYSTRAFQGLDNVKILILKRSKCLSNSVSFCDMPKIETLTIISNPLEVISARNLSNLTNLTLTPCDALKVLSLPVGKYKEISDRISKQPIKASIEKPSSGVLYEAIIF